MLINGERVECVGMIVYHGTDSISTKIDLRRGNKSVDNGAGFYTTPNLTFAMQRARTAAVRVSGFHTDEAVEPAMLEMDTAGCRRERLDFRFSRKNDRTGYPEYFTWKSFIQRP